MVTAVVGNVQLDHCSPSSSRLGLAGHQMTVYNLSTKKAHVLVQLVVGIPPPNLPSTRPLEDLASHHEAGQVRRARKMGCKGERGLIPAPGRILGPLAGGE